MPVRHPHEVPIPEDIPAELVTFMKTLKKNASREASRKRTRDEQASMEFTIRCYKALAARRENAERLRRSRGNTAS